jgi:thiol-disulfide isomerase/thioredoxin
MIKTFIACILVVALSSFSPPSFADSEPTLSVVELLDKQLKNEVGKIVYVDFWASWCIPCRASFPWMNNLKAQYQAQGLTILSINLDHSRALADEFLLQNPASFPVIYDPKGLIARKYKLSGMPSSFIINRQGQIVSVHVGFNQEKKVAYEKELIALLNSTAQKL